MTGYLDMTLFPAADPDTVLDAEGAALLRAALTATPGLSDERWRRMLDVTWQAVVEPDGGTDPLAYDPAGVGDGDPDDTPLGPDESGGADPVWAASPGEPDGDDLGVDDGIDDGGG